MKGWEIGAIIVGGLILLSVGRPLIDRFIMKPIMNAHLRPLVMPQRGAIYPNTSIQDVVYMPGNCRYNNSTNPLTPLTCSPPSHV